MRKSILLALLSLLLLGILLRLLPLDFYLYWGSDSGEYYVLSKDLVDTGRLPATYTGWGAAYPNFPGMEALTAAGAMAGLPLEGVLFVLAPILASLSIVAIFLLVVEVSGDGRAGLIGAAFVAVSMPHVLPTSHAIPGSIGDLLYASALLLFLRSLRDRRWISLLLPVLGAIIVVHHFSTYFLLISLAFVVLARILYRREGATARARLPLALIVVLLAMTMAYWYLFAIRFRDGVLTDDGRLPLWFSLVGLMLIPVGLLGLAAIRRRIAWEPTLPYPPWRRSLSVLLVALAFFLGLGLAFTLVPVTGTTIMLTPGAFLLFSPILALSAFAAPGRRPSTFLPGGIAMTGTLAGLTLSLALGALVAPRALIPYRHVEYILVPAAFLIGLGFTRVLGQGTRGPRGRVGLVIILALLLAGTAVSAYPPREDLGGFFEGYYPQGQSAVHWSSGYVDGVIASDHRVSTMLFGFGGMNATWDRIDATLHAPSFSEARPDMVAVKLQIGYCRVDYVLIDRDVIAGAELLPWNPALPLNPEAQAKFSGAPYQRIYDDGYSQVYWVNWGLVPAPPPAGCRPLG